MNMQVVPHFSELDYVFGLPALSAMNLIEKKTNNENYDYDYTPEEHLLSMKIILYWSNFAKHGLVKTLLVKFFSWA